ncbi:MAG: redox-sensing transcriptional repressor Rex [Dehalococcoidia bacterium]|nr:redox-sensing transcriptional repressor Rex [Dehalococcoidia bacterium]
MPRDRQGDNLQVEVPEVVVLRLPLYLRTLTLVTSQGLDVISSQELGEQLHMTPAQIRKDLSYFGRFGKQGRGYSVRHLVRELRRILGLNQEWEVVLVGVGRLGRAVLSYPGFKPEGFRVVAAFDDNPSNVGEVINEVQVHPVEALPQTLAERHVRIAIVAVPVAQTQPVVNLLVQNGVQAILNYAPYSPEVPPGVRISNIDPVLALQSMTFYLAAAGGPVPNASAPLRSRGEPVSPRR